jgi:hypothetical protein
VCVCECSGGMFCLPPSRTCSGANSTGPFMAQTAQSDELLSRRVRAQLTGWFASLHPGPAQVQTALVPSWHKQHRLTNCLLSRRVRAQLTGWFASIQYLLGDKNCDSSLEAKQHDHLSLIKHVRASAYLTYVLGRGMFLFKRRHRTLHNCHCCLALPHVIVTPPHCCFALPLPTVV